jgi:predicted esterase
MRTRVLPLVMVVLLAPMAACADDEPDEAAMEPAVEEPAIEEPVTEEPAAEEPAEAVTELDVVYGAWEERPLKLHLFAPAQADGAPIVMFLGGRGGSRSDVDAVLVETLVEEGAIVVSVGYAAQASDAYEVLRDHGVNARAMADSVACAIHVARTRAAELGSDDPVVAVAGFSLGGGVAAHVALSGSTLEARWEEFAGQGGPPRQVECEVTEGSTDVGALIGMGGAYDLFVPIYEGRYGLSYQQELDPALWQVLSSSVDANPDPKVRLIHGETDSTVPYANSVDFEEALTDAGFDVELVAFEGGHTVPSELAAATIIDAIGP